MASETKKTVTGGCHCGYIKYTAAIKVDGATGMIKATRCNCTYCQKLGTTNHMLDGPADFELLSPASRDEIKTYTPNVKTCLRYFCEKCGMHVWMEGYYEANGYRSDIFALNLRSVDQPQDGVDLSKVKVQYYDMLHNNFGGGLADKPWVGGLL